MPHFPLHTLPLLLHVPLLFLFYRHEDLLVQMISSTYDENVLAARRYQNLDKIRSSEFSCTNISLKIIYFFPAWTLGVNRGGHSGRKQFCHGCREQKVEEKVQLKLCSAQPSNGLDICRDPGQQYLLLPSSQIGKGFCGRLRKH